MYYATSTPRTHESIMSNVRSAAMENDAVSYQIVLCMSTIIIIIDTQVMGIKGASVLCTQQSFDLSTGVVVDVMHCVFLGLVEKTLMGFWFGASFPYSIRTKVINIKYYLQDTFNVATNTDYSL